MASRKSIKDLVRQEVEKPSELDAVEPKAPETEAAKPPVVTDKPSQAMQKSNTSSKVVSRKTSTSRRSPTKADLEAMVKELRADLQAAMQTEETLQEQITQLKTEADEKGEASPDSTPDSTAMAEAKTVLQSQVSELKSELSDKEKRVSSLENQVGYLTTELDTKDRLIADLKKDQASQSNLAEKLREAEKAALKLTQKNADLVEEIELFKQQTSDPQPQVETETSTSQIPLQSSVVRVPHQPHLITRPQHATHQPENVEDFSRSTWLL
ncbi:MAG: hypothetical protein ACFBSC_04815 [Microcoleaceae cyanobacterium]